MYDVLTSWPYRTELDYLAVHPENQGRGIATQLVASGLEEAKKINKSLSALGMVINALTDWKVSLLLRVVNRSFDPRIMSGEAHSLP